MASAAVVLAVRSGGDAESSGSAARPSASGPASKEPEATTTTGRFAGSDGAIRTYCREAGEAWADVPPHVPGEPARTYVHVPDPGVDSAGDVEDVKLGPKPPVEELGGSTVLSPATDGVFTDDLSVMERTRSVTCVELVGTEDVGRTCDYGSDRMPTTTMRLARNRYSVTVYELHSGGVLHRGEIVTEVSGCPDYAYTGEPTGQLARAVTNEQLLAWLESHFVGGEPV